jgi:hypothetical protein
LCAAAIHRGDPVLEISVHGVARVFRRCGRCADPPADLPPLVEPVPVANTPTPLVRFTPHMLPIDWKTRAGNDQ